MYPITYIPLKGCWCCTTAPATVSIGMCCHTTLPATAVRATTSARSATTSAGSPPVSGAQDTWYP